MDVYALHRHALKLLEQNTGHLLKPPGRRSSHVVACHKELGLIEQSFVSNYQGIVQPSSWN